MSGPEHEIDKLVEGPDLDQAFTEAEYQLRLLELLERQTAAAAWESMAYHASAAATVVALVYVFSRSRQFFDSNGDMQIPWLLVATGWGVALIMNWVARRSAATAKRVAVRAEIARLQTALVRANHRLAERREVETLSVGEARLS